MRVWLLANDKTARDNVTKNAERNKDVYEEMTKHFITADFAGI